MKNSWSTAEKVILALLLVVGIGSVGVLIGLAFVPPDKPTQLGTLSQGLATLGVLATAVIMWMSVRVMRHQAEQQRQLWEQQREAASKPLPICPAVWFDGTSGNLGVRLANNGRPLVDSKRSLVLGDLASAIAYKDRGSERVSGEASELPLSVKKRDMEASGYVEAFFEGHSIRTQGKQFAIVIEYWDLEGRAYIAGWEFRTETDTPGKLRVDRVDQMPPKRVHSKDRR